MPIKGCLRIYKKLYVDELRDTESRKKELRFIS